MSEFENNPLEDILKMRLKEGFLDDNILNHSKEFLIVLKQLKNPERIKGKHLESYDDTIMKNKIYNEEFKKYIIDNSNTERKNTYNKLVEDFNTSLIAIEENGLNDEDINKLDEIYSKLINAVGVKN